MATSTPVKCNSTGSHKFRVYVANASDNAELTETTYKRSLTTRGEFYNYTTSVWRVSGTVATTFTPSKTFSYESSITTTTKSNSFSSVGVASKSTNYSNTTSNYNHAVTFKRTCESYTITNKTVGTVSSYTTTYTGSAVTIAARTKYTITYNLNRTGAVHATGYQTYCTACGGDHKSYGYSAKLYTNSSGTALTPTCTGYKFLGWSTSSTATTATYQSGDTYSTNANLTLYGVWGQDTQKPSKPTITVSGTGIIPQAGRIGTFLIFASTDNVGITGYYWGTSSSASVTFTSVTSTTNWSHTYPHWGEGTYYLRVKDAAGNISDYTSMTFYNTTFSVTNGSIGSPYAYGATAPSGTAFILPTITPNTGYASPGYWSYNGTNVGAEGANYTTPSESRQLIAICTSQTTVTLSANSGTGAKISKPTYSYTIGKSGGTISYEDYFGDPVGYTAESPHSGRTNKIYVTNGETAWADYSFDFSCIPSNATIDYVLVECNGRRESASISSSSKADIELYYGDSYSSSNVKATTRFTSTTSQTIRINEGTWTLAQLKKAKLRFTVAYYGGNIYGITWKVKYTSSSNMTETLYSGTITNNIVGKELRAGYGFLGWYTSSSGGTQVFDSEGKYTTSSTYWSSGQWNYSGSTLTLYARWQSESQYTLTVRYYLNGGSITNNIYEFSSTRHYRAGSNNFVYTCNANGNDAVIDTNTATCYPSQSEDTYIDLLNYSTYGAYRNDTSVSPVVAYTITSTEEYITKNGTLINQQTTSPITTNAATVYNLLDGRNLTSDITVDLYVNWNTGGKYALDIYYQINGGTQSSDPYSPPSSSHYYTTVSSGIVFDCDSTGVKKYPHKSHIEYLPGDPTIGADKVFYNLLNYGTYGAQRSGYSVPSQAEYITAGAKIAGVQVTSGGTLINQDTGNSTDTNAATAYNLLDGQSITGNAVVTININWTSNTGTIYVKTDQGWKKGIVYVKINSTTWKQGTPYVKINSTTWKQGV